MNRTIKKMLLRIVYTNETIRKWFVIRVNSPNVYCGKKNFFSLISMSKIVFKIMPGVIVVTSARLNTVLSGRVCEI